MSNKQQAKILSKLFAEYADKDDSFFELDNGNNDWKKTYSFPSIISDLSWWRVSKPRKINWLKVPMGTLILFSIMGIKMNKLVVRR